MIMSQLKWKALGEWSSYLKHWLLSTLQKHDPVVKAMHTGYMYNAHAENRKQCAYGCNCL